MTGRDSRNPGLDIEAFGRKTRLPDDFISACTSAVVLLCLYSVLCIFLPAALGVRANPAVMPANPKPEWYFLFLYAYARFVPPLVGALTPMLLLVILASWPYLDRNPSRDPRKRVLALLLVSVVFLSILALTYAGWVG
jgi:ubiquinol-cytochrome c reductase cytochrome b subunit